MLMKKYLAVCGIVILLLAGALLWNVTRTNADSNASTQAVWLAQDVGDAREAIAFDRATNAPRFILPKGLRSADGRAYWAAFRAGGVTALHSFDANDGSIRASFALDGDWEPGAISATGKWLALKRVATEMERAAWKQTQMWKTTIAILDTTSLKITRTISLDGNFDIDALNADGSALFLIQHLPALNPDHYEVRKYDTALGQLLEGRIVDKRNANEEMAGYPSQQVAAPDGKWLFTLYVGMKEGHAFIHALNLQDGFAWCIDLPSGDGKETTQAQYALALAPDGHTIYASNAALGTLAIADVMNIGEPRIVRFTPFVDDNREQTHASVVSADGKQVYWSNGSALWEYDVANNVVSELPRSATPILALDADTNALLVAQADHSARTLPIREVSAQAVAVGGKTKACPITQPATGNFSPPAPYSPQAPFGEFWYGSNKLWTALRPDGRWFALPYDGGSYTQKIVWWREGYLGTAEPQPALKITGKQLDGNETFVVEGATNAHSSDFGGNGWAIMSGVEIPSLGCWEITGEYKGERLGFVVQVSP